MPKFGTVRADVADFVQRGEVWATWASENLAERPGRLPSELLGELRAFRKLLRETGNAARGTYVSDTELAKNLRDLRVRQTELNNKITDLADDDGGAAADDTEEYDPW
jgi:hypothetical protein